MYRMTEVKRSFWGRLFSFMFICVTLFSAIYLWAKQSPEVGDKNEKIETPTMIEKTEEEWKEQLTAEQYRILRNAGTERPNGTIYKEFKEQGAGVYFCIGCDTELFSSNEKFDSHCGWPSFFDPSKVENVKTSVDHLLGYARTEVLCAVCDGHLGHIFSGEGFDTPTDKRYCINGTVLRFRPHSRTSDTNASNIPASDAP
jgi:peptide-methionine (R)-S-oxide reductase